MARPVTPWLLVIPLGTVGVLAGHEVAYAITSTTHGDLHGYLSHGPQVALLFVLLSLGGASVSRHACKVRLWPFPAVALAGFVAQEHLERLVHSGTVPFLLGKPVFLAGLGIQTLVALAVWLVARLLVRTIGGVEGFRPRAFPDPRAAHWPLRFAGLESALSGAPRARSPPLGR